MKNRNNKSKKNNRLKKHFQSELTPNYQLFETIFHEEICNYFGNVISNNCEADYETNTDLFKMKYHTIGTIYEFASFKLATHPLNNGVCLHNLVVFKNFRNKKIASNLLKIMTDTANQIMIPIYLIPVEEDNVDIEVLRSLYHKFGFKRESDSYYWKYTHVKTESIIVFEEKLMAA